MYWTVKFTVFATFYILYIRIYYFKKLHILLLKRFTGHELLHSAYSMKSVWVLK